MTVLEAYQPDAKSVLVIDDSDIDRETMLELLQASGFRVMGLPSPIGATREVRRVRAGLVIIDQNMPVMDGSKLATLFRENPAIQGVRVVLVSGNDEATMGQIAKQAKADAFINKAKLHSHLVPTVQRLLGGA